MTPITAVRIAPTRWSGPEWSRHIAGKAMAEREAKRAPLTWLDELAVLYPPC
jgi:hypothetical protein